MFQLKIQKQIDSFRLGWFHLKEKMTRRNFDSIVFRLTAEFQVPVLSLAEATDGRSLQVSNVQVR